MEYADQAKRGLLQWAIYWMIYENDLCLHFQRHTLPISETWTWCMWLWKGDSCWLRFVLNSVPQPKWHSPFTAKDVRYYCWYYLLLTSSPLTNKSDGFHSVQLTMIGNVNHVRYTDACIFMYTDTAKSLMLKFKILFCLNKNMNCYKWIRTL